MTADALVVEDSIEGRCGDAVARYHLHPDVEVTGAGSRWTLDGIPLHVERGVARIVSSQWHPRFGESLPTRCLEVVLVEGGARCRFGRASASQGRQA